LALHQWFWDSEDMSTAVSTPANVAVPPPVLMRRWTVDEYHTMIRAGVFSRDEKFELPEGWVFPKISRNPPTTSRWK
jgi:hypothetical protein